MDWKKSEVLFISLLGYRNRLQRKDAWKSK